MYRRLKNILGVSLMVLAIVISQIPMPETQAESAKQMTEAELNVDDTSTHVVTFSMNGGTFKGEYNGYSFQDKTPVLVIGHDKAISSFPSDGLASYSGYKTEANTWYTDRECLTKYDVDQSVTESFTLYKKWYNITSDGTTLAPEGFHISADGKVLYQYDGDDALVEIPQTVTVIADGAFDNLDQNVRGIVLPGEITKVGADPFGNVENATIVYVYDSGTTASQDYGKWLAKEYEQLVYSEYLDPDKTEEIVGIHYLSDSPKEESSTVESKPEQKYIVTFDTGISGVSGESREVLSDKTISEAVSVDGKAARILRIGVDQIERNDGNQQVTYIFRGWFKDNACTVPWNFAGDVIKQDTTVYAKWDRNVKEQTNTVTFQMNGGGYTGNYNGTAYTDATSLTTKIVEGKGISAAEYPGNGTSTGFKYSNYSTDTNWYKDKECLDVYKSGTALNGDLTLYKKWYYTSSGFTMNASGNVLYKYSGGAEDVTIPGSVTIIGSDAFASVGGISSITLPDNISEVKENAFSGVNNGSKDIIIAGKTEKAQKVAKQLASQYTRLVYEESEPSKADENDSSVVISRGASSSIKLGATLSGSAATADKTTSNTTASTDNTSTTGTIVLGTGSSNTITVTSVQPDAAASQPTEEVQSVAVSQNTVAPAQQQEPSASVTQETKTTQKQNITSASAPKSTQHIKDSTPKTGDPLQYRMLIACAMFSVGVLLVLTGNGKRKKFSAS